MIELKVPKEILDPVGDDLNILVDFGYLENAEKIENSINSKLDQALRKNYSKFIRDAIRVMIEFSHSVMEIGDLVKKYEEEIAFEEEFGNNLDFDLIEKFGIFISSIFSTILLFSHGATHRTLSSSGRVTKKCFRLTSENLRFR